MQHIGGIVRYVSVAPGPLVVWCSWHRNFVLFKPKPDGPDVIKIINKNCDKIVGGQALWEMQPPSNPPPLLVINHASAAGADLKVIFICLPRSSGLDGTLIFLFHPKLVIALSHQTEISLISKIYNFVSDEVIYKIRFYALFGDATQPFLNFAQCRRRPIC